MANAIVGTGLILAVSSLIGVPMGIGSGIYLAEYGRRSLWRPGADYTAPHVFATVAAGCYEIVIGICRLIPWLVVPARSNFSAFSGGVALGIMG